MINGKLAVQLGLTVNIQRLVCLAVRLPRSGALTVKHIVCGKIHHFDAKLFADLCNVLCAKNVDAADDFLLVLILSCIYSCPCRAVDHAVHASLCDGFFYSSCICNIHGNVRHSGNSRSILDSAVLGGKVRAYPFVSAFVKFVHYIMTKLTGHTCYKQFHKNSPP